MQAGWNGAAEVIGSQLHLRELLQVAELLRDGSLDTIVNKLDLSQASKVVQARGMVPVNRRSVTSNMKT